MCWYGVMRTFPSGIMQYKEMAKRNESCFVRNKYFYIYYFHLNIPENFRYSKFYLYRIFSIQRWQWLTVLKKNLPNCEFWLYTYWLAIFLYLSFLTYKHILVIVVNSQLVMRIKHLLQRLRQSECSRSVSQHYETQAYSWKILIR